MTFHLRRNILDSQRYPLNLWLKEDVVGHIFKSWGILPEYLAFQFQILSLFWIIFPFGKVYVERLQKFSNSFCKLFQTLLQSEFLNYHFRTGIISFANASPNYGYKHKIFVWLKNQFFCLFWKYFFLDIIWFCVIITTIYLWYLRRNPWLKSKKTDVFSLVWKEMKTIQVSRPKFHVFSSLMNCLLWGGVFVLTQAYLFNFINIIYKTKNVLCFLVLFNFQMFSMNTNSFIIILQFKGSDRQSEVVELSMQYCAQIL